MSYSEEEIKEFLIEAHELLNDAENNLLEIEKGGEINKHFDAIFRAFHSIKGAAGMLELAQLKEHMHRVENHLQEPIVKNNFSNFVSYFLESVDVARKIINNENYQFDYELPKGKFSPKENLSNTENIQNVSETQSQKLIKNEKINAFIVDDEEDVADIIYTILEDAGIKCRKFLKPIDLLNQLEIEKPDVILSDINMPDISGLQLIPKLREIDKHIPVIFISGHLNHKLISECEKMGLYGFIEKPFNEFSMTSLVKNAINYNKQWKIIEKVIDITLFQLTDLAHYLSEKKQMTKLKILKEEIRSIMEEKKRLD